MPNLPIMPILFCVIHTNTRLSTPKGHVVHSKQCLLDLARVQRASTQPPLSQFRLPDSHRDGFVQPISQFTDRAAQVGVLSQIRGNFFDAVHHRGVIAAAQ